MDDQIPRDHNRPPGLVEEIRASLATDGAALCRRRDELLASFLRAPAEIADQETSGKVSDLVKLIASCQKNAEGERVSRKEPYLEASRAVDGFFKLITEPLDKAKRALEQRLTAWQRKVADAERRRREEADRLAREEAERQRRDAEAKAAALKTEADLGAAIVAEDKARQAEADAEAARKAAAAKPAELSRERGELGSVASLRTYWDFRDLDRATLDLEILRPHLPQDALEKAVRSFIKAGGRQLRGCDIFENSATVVR